MGGLHILFLYSYSPSVYSVNDGSFGASSSAIVFGYKKACFRSLACKEKIIRSFQGRQGEYFRLQSCETGVVRLWRLHQEASGDPQMTRSGCSWATISSSMLAPDKTLQTTLAKRIGEIRDRNVAGKGVAEHDNAVRQGSLWALKDLDQAPCFLVDCQRPGVGGRGKIRLHKAFWSLGTRESFTPRSPRP